MNGWSRRHGCELALAMQVAMLCCSVKGSTCRGRIVLKSSMLNHIASIVIIIIVIAIAFTIAHTVGMGMIVPVVVTGVGEAMAMECGSRGGTLAMTMSLSVATVVTMR